MKTLTAILALALLQPLLATTITVPTDQPTIQAGIDAAFDGDTVLILPDTYTGPGNCNIDLQGKEIVVRGSAGAAATVIWCAIVGKPDNPCGFILDSEESAATVIEDLTIRRAVDGIKVMPLAAATCQRLVIDSCSYSGIRLSGSPIVMNNCEFSDNARGLAVETSGSTCSHGVFTGNTRAVEAVMNLANPNKIVVDSSEFVNNGTAMFGSFTLTNSTISGGGTGLAGEYQISEESFIAENCLIENLDGPAIKIHHSSTLTDCTIRNCAVVGVLGTEEGVPILTMTGCTMTGNNGGISSEGYLTMNNCLYADNAEGIFVIPHIYNAGGYFLRGSTFANNDGCALHFWLLSSSACTVESTIVVGSSGLGIALDFLGEGNAWIAHSNFWDNAGGNYSGLPDQTGIHSNISLDPHFCDPDAGDYHLWSDSPCAPANNDAGVLIGALPVGCAYECGDFDGDGMANISDAVYLLMYIFGHGPAPMDESGGNVNCDSKINLTDIVYLIYYIFLNGPAPCEGCE